jgi:hypothetical protein
MSIPEKCLAADCEGLPRKIGGGSSFGTALPGEKIVGQSVSPLAVCDAPERHTMRKDARVGWKLM